MTTKGNFYTVCTLRAYQSIPAALIGTLLSHMYKIVLFFARITQYIFIAPPRSILVLYHPAYFL